MECFEGESVVSKLELLEDKDPNYLSPPLQVHLFKITHYGNLNSKFIVRFSSQIQISKNSYSGFTACSVSMTESFLVQEHHVNLSLLR